MAGLKDIAAKAGVDADLAARFVEAHAAELEAGERCIIRGLGTFDRKFYPEREFKTALMDEAVTKPPRYKVTFKPSELLLARLPTPDPDNGSD